MQSEEKAALTASSRSHKKCQVVIWKMPTVRNANWQDRRRRRLRPGDKALSLGARMPIITLPDVSVIIIGLIQQGSRSSLLPTSDTKRTFQIEIFCSRPSVTKRPKLFWLHLLFCRILNWLNYLIEVSYCMQEPVETS